ncbi:MAG: type II toxin-antitoxin system RelE/ParE family toxin [Ignavibacteriales bacterium]|nr:MAG: type II toxin-antitoxin system RelE/ParE family toxin [Ignavibacteriales bacterium]
MNILVDRVFEKDIGKIRSKKILSELKQVIIFIERAQSIHEIRNSKNIEGYSQYYRIKISEYRLGLEKVSSNEVKLIRFLHRKEVYRYFPR